MDTHTEDQEPREYQEALNARLDERYIVAYNKIDRHMRERLGQPVNVGFAKLAIMYSEKWPWVSCKEALLGLANLRNLIAHRTTALGKPFFLPSAEALHEIEDICAKMLDPARVLPCLEKNVQWLDADADMKAVMNLINDNDYSQFPVYAGEEFKGLLTENGITRCLARRIHNQQDLLSLPPSRVGDVLIWESNPENCIFVSADCTLEQLVYCFAIKARLEAALITVDGEKSRELKGIATRFDIMELSRYGGL